MGFENEEILQDFIIEALELVESLDHDFVELETRKDDLDLLNQIFRAAHTIKGSSSFLGLNKLMSLTHEAEEILNKLRKGEMKLQMETMDVLLEFVDLTKHLLADVQSGEDTTDIDAVVKKLKILNEGKTLAGQEEPPAVEDQQAEEDNEPLENANTPTNVKKVTAVEQTIRVDVSRLDALMNMIGELVLSRNRLTQLSHELEGKYDNDFLVESLQETTSQIGLITTELQLAVMKTRMIPIGKVFNKFPRIVRDITRSNGKEIDLIITGEETELDKSIVEEIGDPLIHMIRNACDHGIESPLERASKDKSSRGTVNLSAYHEGNHIVIEIADDGKGLSPEKLTNKAIEKGIITAAEAKTLSKEDTFALIFKPGFSTATEITSVSGRGVGMDVVKTNIEKSNGIVTIDSEVNAGTVFKMKLPLTLAIIQALLVDVGGETFAIPLVSVIETVRIGEESIHTFEGREVLKLRNNVLSLIRLDDMFELEASNNKNLYVVVVGFAEKKIGFIVNKLLGQEEIVIKSLGEYLGNNEGIAGATIMGDGKVRLILDVAGVINLAQRSNSTPRRKHGSDPRTSSMRGNMEDAKLRIALVDDSSTDRRILLKMLSSANHIEAISYSNSKDLVKDYNDLNVDLVITDIMMPGMDGHELAKTLRLNGSQVPIIAVSSRNDFEEQKKANASGINLFLIKPIRADVLLDKISELTNHAVVS